MLYLGHGSQCNLYSSNNNIYIYICFKGGEILGCDLYSGPISTPENNVHVWPVMLWTILGSAMDIQSLKFFPT